MQFCRARFKGRSRRWGGLDPYINQALPAELRTLDQMCMSEQYYFLGAFHCGGIMMAVLGMLLVLKSGGGSATSGALDRPPFWGRAAAILTPPLPLDLSASKFEICNLHLHFGVEGGVWGLGVRCDIYECR